MPKAKMPGVGRGNNPNSKKNMIPNHGQGIPGAGAKAGSRQRSAIAKKWLSVEEDITNPLTRREDTLCQEDIMTLGLIQKARRGDVGAYNSLLASAYGPPGTNKDVDGDELNTKITLID